MSELNLDEMTREELKEQADILDIEYARNATDEKLRTLISEALGESDPDAAETAEEPAKAAKTATKKVQMYRGMIHKDGKDKQPVPIAVNGRVIRIKRGETVEIEEPFYLVLENAIKRVWDPDLEEMIEVPAYGHSFQKI